MRLTFLLCLALAACSEEPAPAFPDHTADAVVLDIAPPDTGWDVGPVDAGDASETDAGPMDVPATVDAGTDVGADVDPRASEVCQGVVTVCNGRGVNVQTGERDGGLTYHCGACGVTCAAGSFCVACVCER